MFMIQIIILATRSYCVSENKIIFTTSEGNYISLIYSDDDGASWQNGMITDTSGYIIYMNFLTKIME